MCWVLLKRVQHGYLQPGGYQRVEFARRTRRFREMLYHDRPDCLSDKRTGAGKQLVKHHTDAIDIALRDSLPVDLLGSHILRRSRIGQRRYVERCYAGSEGGEVRHIVVLHQSRGEDFDQTKVGEKQGVVCLEEQVGGLDIAMHETVVMGILER